MSDSDKKSAFNILLPMINQKKRNYEIHEKIGYGTYAKVMRATWHEPLPINPAPSFSDKQSPTKTVALKIIKKKKLRTLKKEDTYVELKYMKNLDHPNIVKLHEVFETCFSHYLSFEYLAGGELFDRLYDSKDPFRESDAVHILKSVLKGLEYLHLNDIVHRDIKSENIVFRTNDRYADVVIVDFGLARRLSSPDQLLRGIIGSYNYMAPEVLTRVGFGKKIDTWATGILAHQLLTGLVPFYEEDFSKFEAFVQTVKEGKIDFDPDIWEDVTEDAKDFVVSLVNVNVRERLSASDALSHPWMTKPSPADGLILRGVREDFDPRLRWRCAINGTVALRRFWNGRHTHKEPDDLISTDESSGESDLEIGVDLKEVV